MAPAEKKKAAPAVKKVKKKALYTVYKASGSKVDRLNKFCPKCGDGFLMAEHPNRRTCGKCTYTEIKTK